MLWQVLIYSLCYITVVFPFFGKIMAKQKIRPSQFDEMVTFFKKASVAAIDQRKKDGTHVRILSIYYYLLNFELFK